MSNNAHTIDDLHQMQAAPLSVKVRMTQSRIRDWVNYYGVDGVYVSFSGGKDSTVLLTIAREMYPDIKAVFVDTGLEYPEIREFVKTFDNVDWVNPKMTFRQVIKKYGYPFISKEVAECVYGARRYLTSVLQQASIDRQTDRQTDRQNRLMPTDTESSLESVRTRLKKFSTTDRMKNAIAQIGENAIDNLRVQRLMGINSLTSKVTAETIPSEADRSKYACTRYQFFLDAPFEISQNCCYIMKKAPAKAYTKQTGRVPITAQMTSESRLRTQVWLKQGCNAFDAKKPMSNPMAFWTEQDVLLYIKTHDIKICSVYGDIVEDSPNDLSGQMHITDLDPEIFGVFDLERPCLKTTGCARTGCVFCMFGAHLEKGTGRLERLKETHPKLYENIMKPWDEGGLGYKEVIDWINEHGNLNIRY